MGELRAYWIPTRSGSICHCYLKFEADAEIARHKYKRCLQYAKNHKHLGDLAADTVRLIGLEAYAFTKETEAVCIAYWTRIRDCHYRRHGEWLELAKKFKPSREVK